MHTDDSLEISRPSFGAFFGKLIFSPRRFYRQYGELLRREDPPYFLPVFLLYALSETTVRLDNQILKWQMRFEESGPGWAQHWAVYWMLVVILSLPVGFIAYAIGQWWYHMRLKWAKAGPAATKHLAGHLYLYTEAIYRWLILIWAVLNTVLRSSPATNDALADWLLLPLPLAWLILAFYSIYVSYTGVRMLTQAKRGRALFWFVIVPGLAYFLAMVWGILMTVKND